jgi:hypothetical protein
MYKKNRVARLAISLASLMVASCATVDYATWARGCGGGGRGGFGGGGFGGGGFDRGGFDRGMGGDDFQSRADAFLRGDDGMGGGRMGDNLAGRSDFRQENDMRPDAFSSGSRVPESQLRAGADQTYGASAFPKAMATDSGFGRIASTIPAGARTYHETPAYMADRGNALRTSFRDYNMYDHGWWGDHPNAWRYPYYGDRYWPWGYSDWGGLCGFWGLDAGADCPEYDYGDNIIYNNNEVYYGSQPAATADQYYSQAQTLAQSATPSTNSSQTSGDFTIDGTPPNAGDWKSLGVFSLAQAHQTSATSEFQLAVDKSGIIRGNYANELTGDVQPVQGAVDKKSMRAAWTVGSNKSVVYDTGVSNLLKPQSPILVHFGKDRTEQWTLVRLNPPSNTKKTAWLEKQKLD